MIGGVNWHIQTTWTKEWVVAIWNPYNNPDIQGLGTFTDFWGSDLHQWNSSQKTNPTNETPTSFSLKRDLFISWKVCQLKSCQPDPNLSCSQKPWSSLQKPFPPQAMVSSDLINETGRGLARTVGDTSKGTPDASGSSWWWFSQGTRLESTPNSQPTVTVRLLGS